MKCQNYKTLENLFAFKVKKFLFIYQWQISSGML